MAEKIKFKVSIKELSFEYEGTREVGQALQAGISRFLAGLVDTQRTAMLLAPPAPDQETADNHPNTVIDQSALKPKKSRKSGGVSVVGLLRELKSERFFSESRTAENIRERLKVKGHTIPASTLSSRLQELTRKNELFRDQSGEGYVYKDTPFNESTGATDAPEQPAQ